MFKKFSHYFNSSDSPQVTLITRQFDTHEMPRLYKSADCFVLPSRGEGWGMCYLEAMACGLPTIASRYSGNLHFMNDQNSLLVDILEMRPDVDSPYKSDTTFQFGEPDFNDLQKKLRLIYEDRNLARALGEKGLATACDFTWLKQAEKIKERCEFLCGEGNVGNWEFLAPVLSAGEPSQAPDLNVHQKRILIVHKMKIS